MFLTRCAVHQSKVCAWFLELVLSRKSVCVRVCVPPKLLITSGVMWHVAILWVKEFLQLFMAAIVGNSRCNDGYNVYVSRH